MKESLWDRVVFDGTQTKILGEGGATLHHLSKCVVMTLNLLLMF